MLLGEIGKEPGKSDFNISNLEEQIEFVLELSSKLDEVWELASHSNKEKLQYLLFADGIPYDRKNSLFRT